LDCGGQHRTTPLFMRNHEIHEKRQGILIKPIAAREHRERNRKGVFAIFVLFCGHNFY
jgi:hypothetical protein